MNTKVNKNEFGLLPNYFRKIILILIIALISTIIICKFYDVKLTSFHKEITMNVLIFLLWNFSMCKSKIEDEMILKNRLKAMSFAFGWAAIMPLVNSFMDIKFEGNQLILSMLLAYITMFEFIKYKQ